MSNKSSYLIIILCMCFSSISSAQEGGLTVDKLFTIAEGLEVDEPGFLVSPRSVVTDKKGNIFISDYAVGNVKMYSREGEYIQSFGRGGRGPGEFSEVSEIALDSEGRLLVLDRMSFKVARFNVEDGSVEEHYFEDMREINMMTLVSLPDDRLAGVYMELGGIENAPDDTKAIRVYKFGEGEKESSHYEIFAHQFDKGKPIEERMAGGIGHQLTSLGSNVLAIGHEVYMGKISIVDLKNEKVISAENPEISDPFYIVFENISREELREISGAVSSSGRAGNFRYQILYYSHLLEGNNKLLFHIFDKNEPNGKNFSTNLEVFNKEGELKYYKPFPKNFLNEKNLGRLFLHIDENGRLFVLKFYENRDSQITVYQLNLDELGLN